MKQINVNITPEIIENLRRIVLSGKYLDNFANHYGLNRKRRWLIFKETDSELRTRVLAHVRGQQ